MSSTSSTRGPLKDPLRLAAWGTLAVCAAGGLLHAAGRALALPEAVICPFRALTGLPCPGCGMTRAFLALGRLDIAEAFSQNPLSLPLAALLLLYLAGRVPGFLRSARLQGAALAGVLLFWGWRLAGQLR